MGEITPFVFADFDPEFGTPTFICSTTAFLTRRSTNTATEVVADFVNTHPATFGVSLDGGALLAAGEFPAAEYRVIRDYVTPGLGVRHLTYQQRHNGQDVYGSLLTANVTTDGMLVNIGSAFLLDPSPAIVPPTCGARDAIAAACDAMNDPRIADIVGLVDAEDDCTTDWTTGQVYPGIGDTSLYVQSVVQPVVGSNPVQAWVVRLPLDSANGHVAWGCVVRHSDLSLLRSHDMTMHMDDPDPVQFKIFPDDSPVPGTPGIDFVPAYSRDTECAIQGLPDGCSTSVVDTRAVVTVSYSSIELSSPNGWMNDPWTDPQGGTHQGYSHCALYQNGIASQTCGNNVRVISSPSYSTVAGPNRVFNCCDPESAESLVVQVFHVANEWHDRLYQLGFDEVAGNCQQYNFGKGGTENDALTVWVNDGTVYNSGTTDITGGVIEDGGVLRIRLGVGAAVNRATALDRTLVYHELTHVLSARLHNGSVYTPGAFPAGLWEGWGHYFAVALTTKPPDDIRSSYPILSWSGRPPSAPRHHYYYGGQQRFPFTSNMTPNASGPQVPNNPLHYGHADPGDADGSPPPPYAYPAGFALNPHVPVSSSFPRNDRNDKYRLAEIWANMLLDCRVQLRGVYGDYDANEVVMQLVVDGMKLDPAAPTFITARNAILQADLLRYSGAHQRFLWEAFRRRQLGWTATEPINRQRGQNFQISDTLPPTDAVSFFFPDGIPTAIATCEPTPFDVLVIAPTGVLSEVRGNAVSNGASLGLPATAQSLGNGLYRVQLGAAPCRQSWELFIEADTGGTFPTTSEPVVPVYAGVEEVALQASLEDGEPRLSEWTVTPLVTPPSQGEWHRVDPVGGPEQPAYDTTAGLGVKCWVTQNRTDFNYECCRDDVDYIEPGVILESPALNVSPNSKSMIEFSLWYATRNAPVEARCYIEWVHGTMVTPIETLSPLDSVSRWQSKRYAVAYGDGQGDRKLRIRFVDPDPDPNPVMDVIIEGGIDDLRVASIVDCLQCCDGDVNMDGNMDQDDVAYLIDVVGGGPNPSGIDPDFDHDGNVDQGDVEALITHVAGGACP